MSLSFPERSSSDLANLLEQGLSQEPSIMLDIPTRITVTGLMQVAARNLMGPAHHSLFQTLGSFASTTAAFPDILNLCCLGKKEKL